MTNPYAPPRAAVQDIADPMALSVPADRGTRLGAAILDTFIFGVMVYMPIVIAVGLGGAAAGVTDDSSAVSAAVGVGLMLTLIGGVVWCWLTIRYVRRNGQSIGKKLTGIKVVRSDGSPITLGRLFWLRNFVNGLISIVPLYGIIDSLFIFAESRQCLHDKIADSIVIKA